MLSLCMVGSTCVVTEQVVGLDLCAFEVGYGVGSAAPWAPPGAAHLLEHLLAGQWDYRIPSLSGATTQRDLTAYWAIGSAAALPDLLRMQARAQAVDVIDTEAVLRQQRVVLNELRQRQGKERVDALERLLAAAFGTHGYGRSATGIAAEVEALEPGALQRLHQVAYRAPAVAVIISPYPQEQVLECLLRTELCQEQPAPGPARTPVPEVYQTGALTVPGERTYRFYPAPSRYQPDSACRQVLHQVWQRRLSRSRARVHLGSYAAAGSLVFTAPQIDDNGLRQLLLAPCSAQEVQVACNTLRAQRTETREDLLGRLGHLMEAALDRTLQQASPEWGQDVTPEACAQEAARLLEQAPLVAGPGVVESLTVVPWPYGAASPPMPEPDSRVTEVVRVRSGGRFEAGASAYLSQGFSPLTSRRHFRLRLDTSGLGAEQRQGLYESLRLQQGVTRVALTGAHLLVTWHPLVPLETAVRLTSQFCASPPQGSGQLLTQAPNGGEYLRLLLPSLLDQLVLSSGLAAVPIVGASVLGELTAEEEQLLRSWLDKGSAPSPGALREMGPDTAPSLRDIDLYLYPLPGLDPRLFTLAALAKVVGHPGGQSLEAELQRSGLVYSISAGVAFHSGWSWLWFGLFGSGGTVSPAQAAIEEWLAGTLQAQVGRIEPVSSGEALDRLDEEGLTRLLPAASFTGVGPPRVLRLRRPV